MPVLSRSRASISPIMRAPLSRASRSSSSSLLYPARIKPPSLVPTGGFSTKARCSRSHKAEKSPSEALMSAMAREEKPESWNLRLGMRERDCASPSQSRGVRLLLEILPAMRSMSRMPFRVSAMPMRMTVAANNSSTPSKRYSISSFLRSGLSTRRCISRAPIAVRVLSSSHSKEPRFLPSPSVRTSSKSAMAVLSSIIVSPSLTRRTPSMMRRACFCVSRRYSIRAPQAEMTAGSPAMPKDSSVLQPSCSNRSFSAWRGENAHGT